MDTQPEDSQLEPMAMRMSTLFEAIESGDAENCASILEGEVNFSKRNRDGKTPIELSVLLGKDNLVELFLQKGASANEANCSGGRFRTGSTTQAVLYHQSNLVEYFRVLTGYTPLHLGAIWGRVTCLKVLINVGSADQMLKTECGETVRDLAQRYNQMGCTVYLECAGEYTPVVTYPGKLCQGLKNGVENRLPKPCVQGHWKWGVRAAMATPLPPNICICMHTVAFACGPLR